MTSNQWPPRPRQPVNIPGQLTGTSHEGAILYTLATRDEGGGTNGHYLDASAYDDVSVWLVDSLRLPGDGGHPVLAAGTNIFLARPATASGTQIEAWILAESTGRFTLRVSAALPVPVDALFRFPGMVVAQMGNELNLLDAGTPNRLGAGRLPLARAAMWRMPQAIRFAAFGFRSMTTASNASLSFRRAV